jgi:hypothetical protein
VVDIARGRRLDRRPQGRQRQGEDGDWEAARVCRRGSAGAGRGEGGGGMNALAVAMVGLLLAITAVLVGIHRALRG